jgi:SAM-dependent methyltransferase
VDSNLKTLETYNEHFSNYVDGTAQVTSGFQKEWLEYLLGFCRAESRILEIGAAFGRDATFIANKGFAHLLVTDAFDAAVVTLRRKGFNAAKLNLLRDDITDKYDLVIASAVFLHFTVDEFHEALTKLKTALSDGGRLGFSVKSGIGEEWSDAKMGAPRFFHYWSEESLRQALAGFNYEVIDLRQSEDGKWLHVTARPRG